VYFAPPLTGSPCNALWVKKTKIRGIPGEEKSVAISSAVWIQLQRRDRWTDGRTDRQTDTGRLQRPCLRIASRGKNNRKLQTLQYRGAGPGLTSSALKYFFQRPKSACFFPGAGGTAEIHWAACLFSSKLNNGLGSRHVLFSAGRKQYFKSRHRIC